MKNPLIKRVKRELVHDKGKYIALFLFIVLLIGFVSGFIVADDSMKVTYDESFEKYRIEDGNFTLSKKAKKKILDAVRDEGTEVYPLFYKDKQLDNGDDVRIYITRDEVNRQEVWEGELPDDESEIALDRLYMENNGIDAGDTVSIGDHEYKVTGSVALSDYSALFKDNAQFMFDANNFSVGIVDEDGFDRLGKRGTNYKYAWVYDDRELTDDERRDREDEIKDALIDVAYEVPSEDEIMRLMMEKGTTDPSEVIDINEITEFLPRSQNQAINFTGDDMGRDKVMILTILYLVILMLALIFGVTAKSTIERESAAVGTLRAMGYSRAALLIHYVLAPEIVTMLAAAAGNVLGYTVLKETVAGAYLHSYSLMPYRTVWSTEAFVYTTVIPLIIVLVVNILVILMELRRTPISLLRGDHKNGTHLLTPKLRNGNFISRFRTRVLLQNIPSYLIMAAGIFLAIVILIFCLGLRPLLDHMKTEILDSQIAEYQYVLKEKHDPGYKNAEKYQMSSLRMHNSLEEEISVYGIKKDSIYADMDIPSGRNEITISSAFSEKYDLEKGDTITLYDEFNKEDHEFKVAGVHDYQAGLAAFMGIRNFNRVFDNDEDDYLGYFSDKKLSEIPEEDVAAVITDDDLTITADQMIDSMGSIFNLFGVFGALIFMIVIYLLSKLIVDKNAKSISMAKILGYNDREITSIYSRNTLIVVLIVIALSLPASKYVFAELLKIALRSFNGWLDFYVDGKIFIEIAAIGVISYAVVYFLQLRNIRKVSMGEALKGME